ncbi:RNA polymerase sigma-70 factor [Tenacibaculum holothuriorum]|uniref:RNA polymerase sigma-70 factor n=1 Tax=Tenacibaculum holothuriorum TaxID=1635173 RepID=A0A1Y2PDK1_9FLAO|nr:sigma-70 family RNA polymerase sigma factor [Tenacibaculum holothuriorum]OSY88566.1 RNA polymerase sigma-70 factor [Tenacibaculum holothuriorum]
MMDEQSVCKPKVFEKVFNEHSEALRNYMYYKSGDMNLAEDIVQESYVKLWKNCAKVLLQKAKSFLFTVANNMFLNDIAHKKVVLKHQQQGAKSYTNESPEFVLQEKEFMVKLQNAIADLPEKQREVFLLNRIDKKKYKEIAEMLGISVKAVEKRMSLALKNLREKIEFLK